VGHVVGLLDVFADTPTGNHCGPPSTSFPRAEQLHPFGVRLRLARYARLRSASPQRGEAGGKKDKLQKQIYTGVEPVFGIIKEIMGFRRFLLRGREKVTLEWLLVCVSYNLKRLFTLKNQIPAG
jgi:hypothetical protein